jgi:hypothetical protein
LSLGVQDQNGKHSKALSENKESAGTASTSFPNERKSNPKKLITLKRKRMFKMIKQN